MKNPKKLMLIIITILALISLAACSILKAPLTQTRTLEGSERDIVLAYADSKGENLIRGMVAGDYAVFSADFDSTMKQGMDENAFNNMLVTFTGKLGQYQSHEVNAVLQDEKYSTVVYRIAYDKDDRVTMRVVFNNSEDHNISGLWFDSPELRK